jgi:hypothetical protein
MILWEVKEALKKLLDENNETIYITDTESCFAEDVISHLLQPGEVGRRPALQSVDYSIWVSRSG